MCDNVAGPRLSLFFVCVICGPPGEFRLTRIRGELVGGFFKALVHVVRIVCVHCIVALIPIHFRRSWLYHCCYFIAIYELIVHYGIRD